MCDPYREWCRRGGYDILCVDIYKRTTSETLADFIEHGYVLDNASQAFVRPLCVHRTTSASTFILVHSADGTYERTCRRAGGWRGTTFCVWTSTRGRRPRLSRIPPSMGAFSTTHLRHSFALSACTARPRRRRLS